MGFSYTSKGLRITAGEKLILPPIPIQEPSVLELSWKSADDVEVEFSLNLTLAEGEVNALIPPERLHTQESKMDIDTVGTAVLQWDNCYAGWLGGSICTLSYVVTVITKQEVEEEHRRKQEAEAEEQRLEAERIEAEKKQQEEDEARLRQEERRLKMIRLQDSTKETVAELEETRKLMSIQEEDIARLSEEIAAAEEALSANRAMASVMEKDLVSTQREIDTLLAEEGQEGIQCVDLDKHIRVQRVEMEPSPEHQGMLERKAKDLGEEEMEDDFGDGA